MKRITALVGVATCLSVQLISTSLAQAVKTRSVLFTGPIIAAESIRQEKDPSKTASATPGEMICIVVLDKSSVAPGSEYQFQVDVEQAGAKQSAAVRNVVICPVASGNAALVAGHRLTFTVPRGLKDGEAAAIVLYRGDEIARFNILISARPSPPIVTEAETSGRKEGPLGVAETPAGTDPPNLKLERGGVATLPLYPLADPDQPDSGVFVTFKQGSYTREIKARVMYRGETTRSKSSSEPDLYQSTTSFETARFEARVEVPADLAPGPAQIDVRIRANGETSEPRSVNAIVVNPGPADKPPTPRIVSLTPDRIGIGQATTVRISDINSLGPDPSKVIIVLEQGETHIVLRPEMSTPLLRGSKTVARETIATPGEIKVRVSGELTGSATLRVINPATGDYSGPSNGMPIEIADHVLPPRLLEVRDANDQELMSMRALAEFSARAGFTFDRPQSKRRYVTIHAEGVDYNPMFVTVQFEQGGQTYSIGIRDFPYIAGDLIVVPLPEGIKPGTVKVLVANKGINASSEPAIITAEITEPKQ